MPAKGLAIARGCSYSVWANRTTHVVPVPAFVLYILPITPDNRCSVEVPLMAIDVIEVTSRRDLKRFVTFPFRLYEHCPQWVPPLISDEIKTLRPETNPAFEYCRARMWLATIDGRPAGRIAGIINDRYIEKWNHRYARFGWVDFVDSSEVAAALFSVVEAWARGEGMSGVHGPLGFTDLDPEGLLIEGFDELGTMLDIYNHRYYARHIEALGYAKDTDWVEYEIRTPTEIPDKAIRVGRKVLERGGLRLVPARTARDLLPYAQDVFHLVNDAYAHLYGTVELTQKQVDSYIRQFFGYIDPRFNKVVVDHDGKLVAFGLVFPSLSEALQKARGRLLPFGFVHLLRALKHPTRLDLGLIAVRPEYQGRGIPAIIFAEVTKAAIDCGVTSAETGRELEDNVQVRSLWKNYEARLHKRRRVYLKPLE